MGTCVRGGHSRRGYAPPGPLWGWPAANCEHTVLDAPSPANPKAMAYLMGAQRPSCRAALKEDREGQVLAKGVRTQGASPLQGHTGKPMPDRNSVLNIWHPELTAGDSHRASLQVHRCKNEEYIRYVQSEKKYVPAPCVRKLCREVLYPERWARNPGKTESRGDSNTAGPLRCVALFTHAWGSSPPRPDVCRELSSASWTRRPSHPALKTRECALVCEA